jgi:hypothetical protein
MRASSATRDKPERHGKRDEQKNVNYPPRRARDAGLNPLSTATSTNVIWERNRLPHDQMEHLGPYVPLHFEHGRKGRGRQSAVVIGDRG